MREPGLRFVYPFTTRRMVGTRIRNHEATVSKVNDADGNPIEIAAAGVKIVESRIPHLAYAKEIRANLAMDDAGVGLVGTIDIPAQGLFDYPLEDVAPDCDALARVMPGILGNPTFAGALDGNREPVLRRLPHLRPAATPTAPHRPQPGAIDITIDRSRARRSPNG